MNVPSPLTAFSLYPCEPQQPSVSSILLPYKRERLGWILACARMTSDEIALPPDFIGMVSQ
jgi:hypothetical protein